MSTDCIAEPVKVAQPVLASAAIGNSRQEVNERSNERTRRCYEAVVGPR